MVVFVVVFVCLRCLPYDGVCVASCLVVVIRHVVCYVLCLFVCVYVCCVVSYCA